MTALNGVQPYAPFGDPATRPLTWHGHNPASLVGQPAQHRRRPLVRHRRRRDRSTRPARRYSGIEALARESTTYFVQAADAEGVPVAFTDYGAGTHSAPYWARDLRQWLPRSSPSSTRTATDPRRITHAATEQRWRQWGWQVRSTGPEGWTGLVRRAGRGFTVHRSDAAW